MDRIVLDGGGYVEARLLKPEAHPARAREKIHTERSVFPSHELFLLAYFTACSTLSERVENADVNPSSRTG
jgi:hypothetical protein